MPEQAASSRELRGDDPLSVWAEVPWSHSRTTARAVVLALALGLPEAVASDDDPKEVL